MNLLTILRDERGIANIIPWLIGLTSLINIGHRQAASATLEEEPLTDEQLIGAGVQGFANRGLTVSPQTPAIQEMLRRKSLAKRQEKARITLSGPDPFSTLFGLFSQN